MSYTTQLLALVNEITATNSDIQSSALTMEIALCNIETDANSILSRTDDPVISRLARNIINHASTKTARDIQGMTRRRFQVMPIDNSGKDLDQRARESGAA